MSRRKLVVLVHYSILESLQGCFRVQTKENVDPCVPDNLQMHQMYSDLALAKVICDRISEDVV